MPPGLSLESNTGTISGTPTNAGACPFTVTATDAAACVGNQSYILVILQPGIDYLVGEGPGATNTNRVRVYDANGVPAPVDFQAFGAGKWGTLISSGEINGGSDWEILTGPGPGPVFGPQVRGFRRQGTALAKVNFYAYSTLKFGVNPGSSDLDGDGFAEIQSGAGPGAVFGPHVRAWNFDNVALTPIQKVSFFAYSTLKYGVEVGQGDLDGDGYGEILAGPGPGAVFSAQVRGFDYDNTTLSSIARINFDAFAGLRYGVNAAGGDVDLDSTDEIATAPGPGPSNVARFRGFDVDPVVALQEFEAYPFATLYGGRVGLGDVSQDGRCEMIAGAGRDPAADSTVKTFAYDGFWLGESRSTFVAFLTAGYGCGVNVGAGALWW